MERENLVSNLLENLNKLICVDYSRKIFAQDAFETIIALTTRKLVGQDRYRRILLGQKSVGKTTLLDALLKTSQDHFRNLVCVKITYSRLLCDDIGKLPLEYVIDSLGPTWQIWWCFQKLYYRRGRLLSVLENALLANNIFIFGIIDEFNEVYKGNCKAGADIVDELFQIGCSKMGVMHWILSGSSKHLRMLVTGKLLKEEDRKIYKNYSDRDLNGTKFVPLSIYPFIGASEFRSLVNFYYKDQQISEDRMCQIYFNTAGFPSLVADSVLRQNGISDAYITSCKEHRQNPVLLEIFTQIKARKEISICESEGTALEVFAEWAAFIPAENIIYRYSLSELYELADRGLVRYIPQKPAKVSLGSAVIFKDLWDDTDSTPTVEEIIALRTANQGNATDHDLAGDCCLRYIGMAASKNGAEKIFGFSLTSPCGSYTPMQQISKLRVGERISESFDEIKDRVYKELLNTRDALGFDGVVITGSEIESIAHRIQVKIRQSGELKQDELRKTVNRMKAMESVARAAYEATELSAKWTFTHILATTADLTPESLRYLENESIVVWDKKFLGKHVWPASIQALGKRFKA